ncbi:hypothetical protein EJD97_005067 [Solanum chilense]|uniref:Uncharacterized protein n=1 Tax=Solanum chilense TaxID=4083 RepID=A0A6N2BT17_SOLCI|nr:hypothetical protein EJD97_005067 [Solanum chilense]
MKDSEYVMYLWHETEMRRKEKEDRKKMMQKQADVDSDEKKGQNQHDFVEKTMIDKKPAKENAQTSPQQSDVVQTPFKAKQEKIEI